MTCSPHPAFFRAGVTGDAGFGSSLEVWSCTIFQPSGSFRKITVNRPPGLLPSGMVSCHRPRAGRPPGRAAQYQARRTPAGPWRVPRPGICADNVPRIASHPSYRWPPDWKTTFGEFQYPARKRSRSPLFQSVTWRSSTSRTARVELSSSVRPPTTIEPSSPPRASMNNPAFRQPAAVMTPSSEKNRNPSHIRTAIAPESSAIPSGLPRPPAMRPTRPMVAASSSSRPVPGAPFWSATMVPAAGNCRFTHIDDAPIPSSPNPPVMPKRRCPYTYSRLRFMAHVQFLFKRWTDLLQYFLGIVPGPCRSQSLSDWLQRSAGCTICLPRLKAWARTLISCWRFWRPRASGLRADRWCGFRRTSSRS